MKWKPESTIQWKIGRENIRPLLTEGILESSCLCPVTFPGGLSQIQQWYN